MPMAVSIGYVYMDDITKKKVATLLKPSVTNIL